MLHVLVAFVYELAHTHVEAVGHRISHSKP